MHPVEKRCRSSRSGWYWARSSHDARCMAQKVGCICTLYKVRALPSTQSSESGMSKSFWVVLRSPQNVRPTMVMVSRTLEFTHAVNENVATRAQPPNLLDRQAVVSHHTTSTTEHQSAPMLILLKEGLRTSPAPVSTAPRPFNDPSRRR